MDIDHIGSEDHVPYRRRLLSSVFYIIYIVRITLVPIVIIDGAIVEPHTSYNLTDSLAVPQKEKHRNVYILKYTVRFLKYCGWHGFT